MRDHVTNLRYDTYNCKDSVSAEGAETLRAPLITVRIFKSSIVPGSTLSRSEISSVSNGVM